MIQDQDFKNFQYNVIGSKSVIKGNLELSGDTIISSFIEGSIEVKDKGQLILERGSLVKGKIKASDLEIYGSFEGEIDCSGLVSIRSSAQVSGQIKSHRLVIYPGAIVEMQAHSQPQEES
jgi:cytoskeletal protein CcmA (bactofilin family)